MRSNETALLKRIKLKTRHKLNTLFIGEYHSAFKGYGLSFDSVREYQYGDEVRSIDWNVSARMNHLFIKEYIEERELSVVLMIDLSASLEFGTARNKRELVMEVTTLLLYLAQMNHDRISVLLFTDIVEKFIKPKKGRKYILTVLDEIIKYRSKNRRTSISAAIDFLQQVLKKRSVIFLISDFLDEGYMLKLRLLKKKHDIIPIIISDPAEHEMQLFGLSEFVDIETGTGFLTEAIPGKRKPLVLQEFDSIILNTGEPIEIPILKFFEKRNKTRLTKAV